jgi:LysR family transcriptional regulator, nod-box dependent transcriptional activator
MLSKLTIRRGDLDLNLLTALESLLRERHVTRAARDLRISQPAMSMALSRLRHHFDDPLLVRVGGRLELTARARSMVAPLQSALLQVQSVLGCWPPFDPAIAERTFNLMIPECCVHWLMPRFVPALGDSAPGIRLNFEPFDNVEGTKRLRHGDLDFLVLLRGGPPHDASQPTHLFARRELQPMRWVCVTDAKNRDIGNVVSREQFAQLSHVRVRRVGDNSIEELIGVSFGATLKVGVTVDSVLEVPFILPGTRMVAILPEDLAARLNSTLGLRLIEVPDGVLPRRHADLLWHKRSERDPGHSWLCQLIGEERQIKARSLAV